MRKIILTAVLAATALPGMANAQMARDWHHNNRQEVRQDRRELRHDRRELQRDRRDNRRVAYVAPYRNWRYRTVTTGYQLRPAFYGQRYVISDYGRYNLTAPRANLRWVRYGNDLVLVNVRNGRVVRMMHNRYG